MDFTLQRYERLLRCILESGYTILPYQDYLKKEIPEKTVIMRHDVDQKHNSLSMAKIEKQFGVKASYYFRAVPESWDDDLIMEISAMGHEIGYHYESLTTCHGDVEKAYEDFCSNLKALRTLANVETICMHGSPRSIYDSKDIWKRYDYHRLGIIGEPYFDTDFSNVLYLTDTGRMWDGYKVSVRDKIEKYHEKWVKEGLVFHSTEDIIQGFENGKMLNKVMFTIHRPRWNDFGYKWIEQLVLQNIKNVVKYLIIKYRSLGND